MSGRLQNQDFKSEAELIAAGATASSLLNDSKIYVTANALNKTLDDAIVDGDIGGGGTGKNYIENPSFKTGTTAGWSLFNTTLTSKIPTGSITAGAASITTFAADNTAGTILEGTYSLKIASTGAVTAGHGFISDAFTIDREDYAKVLGFSFAYEKNSGTMDFSGTSANTWAVYIYDVGASAWIQPAGVYNLVQGSGVGIASGTFQTTATGTQYRIAIICITATSGAVEMRFDDFQLGPQKVLAGAAVSDWVSFTPTWASASNPQPSIGNGSISGKWRRVGDSAEVQLALLAGTTTTFGTGTWSFSIPSGLSIDLNKTVIANGAVLGLASFFNAGSLTRNGQVVSVNSTTVIEIEPDNSTGTRVNSTTPFTWASGMALRFSAFLPISGWSSNTVMSQDTDTRVVAARAFSSNSGAWPTTDTVINFATVSYDTHSVITIGAGWNYRVPVSGYYKVSASHEATSSGATTLILRIRKNGSQFATGTFPMNAATSNIIVRVDGQNFFNAGDTIDIAASSSAGTGTFVSSASASVVQIERLSGPATIAASETVAVFASKITGSQTSSGSFQDVASWTVRDSTHGAFDATTGVFTAPISGRFLVTGILNFTGNVTGSRAVKIVKGSADTVIGQIQAANGTSNALPFSGYLQLLAGETAKLQAYQNSGGNLSYVASTEFGTTISFIRVGNY